MTLDELAQTLPNGFHDAELIRYSVNYIARSAQLDLEVWVAEDRGDMELYRPAKLELDGLHFWIVQPPGETGRAVTGQSLTIDAADVDQLEAGSYPKLPSVPPTAFTSSLFVKEWNSFIYFAAEDARLKWTGESFRRG